MNEIDETQIYLTFCLGKENFAANVLQVERILKTQKLTKMPNTPNYLRGMINLNGMVVPVIDARLKFAMAELEITTNTCLIILNIGSNEKPVKVGALVDSVNEVLIVEPHQVKAVPLIGTKYHPEYLNGMIQLPEGIIMLLNTTKVFALAEQWFCEKQVHETVE